MLLIYSFRPPLCPPGDFLALCACVRARSYVVLSCLRVKLCVFTALCAGEQFPWTNDGSSKDTKVGCSSVLLLCARRLTIQQLSRSLACSLRSPLLRQAFECSSLVPLKWPDPPTPASATHLPPQPRPPTLHPSLGHPPFGWTLLLQREDGGAGGRGGKWLSVSYVTNAGQTIQ